MSGDQTVFLSAGEVSGDGYAGRLARELRLQAPGTNLVGLGGERMEAAGVERMAGLDRLAVMGVADLPGRMPYFLRLRRRVRERLVRDDVDLLVAVDYPGFNLPLARFASRRGTAVLYYAPPQVWAWGRRRARRVALWSDLVCTILPFTGDLLRRAGATVEFVGHPLLDEVDGESDVDRRAESAHRDGDGAPLLGLFPGSREQEVRRILPPMAEAARRLRRKRPALRVAVARAPGVPDSAYRGGGSFEQAAAGDVARRSTAALAASGTVTLELALHDTPMAVVYRMSRLNFAVARRLVEVDHVALVNLVHGSRLVPELLQDEATPEEMVGAVEPVVSSGAERERVRAGLREVRRRLGRPGVAGRVANRCVRLLEGRSTAA